MTTWSDEEYGFLAAHPEWSARQVGEALDRSMQSVRHKRNQLRDGWTPIKEPWAEDDVEFVRATPHLTAAQVAKHLGRSESAVNNRRGFLVRTEGLTFDGGKQPYEVGSRRLLAKTCKRCGLLLGASWFGQARNAYGKKIWQTQCTRCRDRWEPEKRKQYSKRSRLAGLDHARKSEARQQALSVAHAHRHGEPWVDADHEVLSNPDLLVVEKAIALGRTYKATMKMCSASGYTSKVGKGDPLKGQWVIDNPNVERMAS